MVWRNFPAEVSVPHFRTRMAWFVGKADFLHFNELEYITYYSSAHYIRCLQCFQKIADCYNRGTVLSIEEESFKDGI